MFIRKFISIGHGGFSKETFYNQNEKRVFSIVYDCGSYRQKEIEYKIDNNTLADKQEVIDILFLSHFDNDHINGVEHLLDRCQVKKLMIPSYNTPVLLTEYIISTTHGSSFSPTPASRIIERVIYHSSIDDVETVYIQKDGDKTNYTAGNHNSGTAISSPIKEIWEYIPYNLPFNEDEYENFYNWFIGKYSACQNENGINISIVAELLADRNVFSEVKREVKKLKGRNKHSMILYSGPVELKNNKTEERAPCLYMGDYEATQTNVSTIINLLDYRWPFIHLLQVPHHGSIHNYQKGSGLYNNHIVGITFASESEENYPAKEIKNEIVENQGIPIKVSYSEYTEVIVVIKNY